MSNKISEQRLKELIEQVRTETRADLAKRLEENIGPKRKISIEELANEVIPQLLSTTFAVAGFHAEYLIRDVLNELDLLNDDQD